MLFVGTSLADHVDWPSVEPGWDVDDESGARLMSVVELDRAVVELDDGAGDGEPEAGAASIGGTCVVGAGEALEDRVVVGRWDARSVVDNRQARVGVVFVQGDGDEACGVAGCVVEQVADRHHASWLAFPPTWAPVTASASMPTAAGRD